MDYELEPERQDEVASATDGGTTEHHESLLRDEAARASRTNRILGSFVVAGFAAAAIVGVVTWQNVSPGHNDDRTAVEEAAADNSMSSSTTPTTSPSGDGARPGDDGPSETDQPSYGRDGDDSSTGGSRNDLATPLTADRYAPPNAWSGDDFVTPGATPEDGGSDSAGGTDGADGAGDTDDSAGSGDSGEGAGEETTTDEGSSPQRPSITDLLPSLPNLPTLPGETEGSGTGEPSESTDPSEPTETTEPSEPSEPSEPAEPSEPSDPNGTTTPSVPGNSAESSAPSTTEENDGDSNEEPGDTTEDTTGGDTDQSDSVTDTTGPTP
ncbi:hypothetical protein ACT3SZ_08750 [Corynebacterium sp. AOP40-9SA-29]|uniref:hypothetical protein n=1 Tax=Corynebacterium sp. AOP40-9SA-29 TaxID=3457677 RepID=UPI0040346FF1